jgi:carbamoyl-phosphate synthase small subunit
MGIDTRQLTLTLRSSGTMLGAIKCASHHPTEFYDPNLEHLVAKVSRKTREDFPQKGKKVIIVDCGMKENIFRSLQSFPLSISIVPFDHDYSNEDYDGIFLSNGPGDPQLCQKTISILKKAMGRNKPIYGICLGAQIMALAAGAKTYKLPFGHRGHNQPCIDTHSNRCYITSQNHGYAIAKDSLQSGWEVTFSNLNDGSVEGIRHTEYPFAAVQFHPEAAPGPTDTQWFFKKFYQSMCDAKI